MLLLFLLTIDLAFFASRIKNMLYTYHTRILGKYFKFDLAAVSYLLMNKLTLNGTRKFHNNVYSLFQKFIVVVLPHTELSNVNTFIN